ncbi:cache domain-containing sensor histidine kinase [Paenibacillus kobensis]|uniref:cache domain-containing sensor histidine kinase n=1 Tax=Paenibacillus kobensis TaxID=59841 RepID=UPI000FD8C689|nr:sensor histidine kinase [Paenibacillus kobensis]
MRNPIKKYKIDRLFFMSFAGLITIVLASTVWASYTISSRELVSSTSLYQQRLLDELNSQLSARLLTIEQISLSTSRDNELVKFLSGRQDQFERYRKSKEVEQSLATLTYSIPIIQGIDLYMDNPFYSDPQSYIQFRGRDSKEAGELNDVLETTDFTWTGEHRINSFQGEVPVLSFARTIMNDDRNVGILVIHIKADSIRMMLTGRSSGVDRLILDASGKQLLAIGDEPGASQMLAWRDKMQGDSGVFRVHEQEGIVGSLIVYSRLPNSNWMLVEVTPWKQLTEGSFKLAVVIGLIGIGAIILTVFLTLWLSKQFARPIKQLVEAMNSYLFVGPKPNLPRDYENEFGYLFSGYRKQNERIEELYDSLRVRYEQQRRAEIEALQANINPHFLYNTLDQLNWMAITAGQERMSRILELMGRMFRIGLSHGESFITIDDELKHVECYLEIQQLRWEEGLTYSIEASSEVRALFIPKMSLQPFVENSIMHGFHGRVSGHIAIRIERTDGGSLRITVEDDGVGMLPESERPVTRHTGGYGIRNVKERYEAYFGQQASVELSNRETGGTLVVIVVPERKARPKNEQESMG